MIASKKRIKLNGKNYPPKRFLICGPRAWDRPFWIFLVIAGLKKRFGDDIVIIEGEARGVDKVARRAAEKLGLEVEAYPPNVKRYGSPAAFHIRNQEMLDDGRPDWVVAIGYGRGTMDMVGRARKAGVMVTSRYLQASCREPGLPAPETAPIRVLKPLGTIC